MNNIKNAQFSKTTNSPFLELGSYSINMRDILYLWKRADSIQCYLQNNTIPLISNDRDPEIELVRLHKQYDSLIRIGDYLVNSENISYLWQREAGTQVYFNFPIPLGGHCMDIKLDVLVGNNGNK